MWKSGSLEVWKFGGVEVRKCGSLLVYFQVIIFQYSYVY